MSTPEQNFSRSQLWPPYAGQVVFAKNHSLEKAKSLWAQTLPDGTPAPSGTVVDTGVLAPHKGVWKIFMGIGARGEWVDFVPLIHLPTANLAARYGSAFENGFLSNGHGRNDVIPALERKLGRLLDPDPNGADNMAVEDYCHDPRLAAALLGTATEPQAPPVPLPPAQNPPPVTPPTPPAPPAVIPTRGQQIDHDLSGPARAVDLPRGVTKVIFEGKVTISAIKGDAIRPLLAIKLGSVEGQRETGALFGVGGREQLRIEWGGRRSKSGGKGFGLFKVGENAVRFEWAPGLATGTLNKGKREFATGVTETAADGGRIVLGVDPGSEYQPLPPGSRLVGVLTFEGGVQQPGPVDPLPPAVTGVAKARHLLELALAELKGL